MDFSTIFGDDFGVIVLKWKQNCIIRSMGLWMFLWWFNERMQAGWPPLGWEVRTHVNLGLINTWGSSLFTWSHFCSLSVIYSLYTHGLICLWTYLCIFMAFLAFLGYPLMKPNHGFVNPGQPSRAGIKKDESRGWILWSTFWHVVRRFAENEARTMACTACAFIRWAGHLWKYKHGIWWSSTCLIEMDEWHDGQSKTPCWSSKDPNIPANSGSLPLGIPTLSNRQVDWWITDQRISYGGDGLVDCIHQRYKSSVLKQVLEDTLSHQKLSWQVNSLIWRLSQR